MGGRELLREIVAPSTGSVVPSLLADEDNYPQLPSIREYAGKITINKLVEMIGAELRFTDLTQTDPAGRYRIRVSGDDFVIARALTANWASQRVLWEYSEANNTISTQNSKSSSSIYYLSAGSSTENAASIGMYANTSGGYIRLVTHNANGLGGYATLRFSKAWLATDVPITGGEQVPYVLIKDTYDASLATTYGIYLQTLNPATDLFVNVARAAPHAATPFWTQIAPDHVPTTSELLDGHITFGYTLATDTLNAYVNEGGAIKTLVFGVMV